MTHAVYYLFDADDSLLYVGASRNALDRLEQHKFKSPFGRDIDHATFTWCESWTEAHALETSEIAALRPRWNISGRGPRSGWQLSDYVEVLLVIGAREVPPVHALTIAKVNRLRHELTWRFPNVAIDVLQDLAPHLPAA